MARTRKYFPVVEDAIRLYLRSIGKNEGYLAEKLNVTQQAINQKIREGFGYNSARKWAEKFGFDPVFLMSGQGQLMLEQVPRSEPQQQTNETRQEEQEVNNNFCVPLVPLAAMGGSLSDYEGSVNDWECEWIPSPIRNATLAISVSGDSMSPEFPNGSTVIVTRINERAFIEWGRTYVLDTVNGVVIKNLVPSEKGDGWVRCVSVNKDPEFAPFDVSLSDVRAIFRVVVSMSVK